MTEKSFTCPECGHNEFKKDYKSECNIETYCTRCGLILKKDDLADEYDDTGWSERGFRPNSWDICYANNIFNYFKEIPLKRYYYIGNEKYNAGGENDSINNNPPKPTNTGNNDIPAGFSRIPDGNGSLSVEDLPKERKVSYKKYLKDNNFEDNDKTKLGYLRRYNQYEFNKCLEIIGNQNIVKQSDKKDVHQPKYAFGSVITPEIPTLKILSLMDLRRLSLMGLRGDTNDNNS